MTDSPRTPAAIECEAEAGHASQHWQRGQTLVVVALMLVALIGFLGLVIDGGNVYAQRRQMQNAADAAALAGARAQALQGMGATVAAADSYAKANGATSCTVMTTTTTVTARAEEDVSTFFVRVIGVETVPVAATATAEITEATELGCGFLPLTIPYRDPSAWPSDPFNVWMRCDPDKDVCTNTIDIHESANGWLNLDGSTTWSVDANELKCWICPDLSECKNVVTPTVAEGWTNGSPGLNTSALQAVDNCAEGTVVFIPLYGDACCDQPSADDVLPACPDASYTPDDEGAGQCHYDIVGFAPFLITYVKDTGDTRAIKAEYVPNYIGGDCLEVGSGGGGKPTGLRVIRLIK